MAEPHSQPGTDEAVQLQMERLRATLIERLWCALAGLSLLMLPVLLWRAHALWSGSQVGSSTTNYVFIAASLFLIGMFPVRSRLPQGTHRRHQLVPVRSPHEPRVPEASLDRRARDERRPR